MVDYLEGSKKKSIPSRLLMLLSHSSLSQDTTDDRTLYALVHSLRSFNIPNYSDMSCFQSDTISDDAKVIHLTTVFQEQHVCYLVLTETHLKALSKKIYYPMEITL